MNNHKSTIRNKKVELPVPRHCIEKGHEVSEIKFMILDHIPPLRDGGDREKMLKRREVMWIKKLNTLIPGGLNVEYPLQVFL